MLVAEILVLANWIDRNFAAHSLVSTYTNLINKLNANVNANSNRQVQQPFIIEREALDDAVGALDLNSLSDAQVLLLKEIGVYDSIGLHGVGVLRDIFVENAIDLPTARDRLQQLKGGVDAASTWAKNTKTALEPLFSEENVFHSLEPNEVVIRIRFTEEAGIYNVVDFKEWSAVWYDIMRGFALSINARPEDYKFVGGTTGSLIAMFASDPVNVAAMVIAVERALSFANNVLDFKLKIRELKESPFKTDEVEKAYEASIENERENAPDIVASQIEQELGLTDNNGERKNGLRKSLEKMFDFFEKGGEVDFVVPEIEDDATDEDYEEAFTQLNNIRAGVERIRIAERGYIALIENEGED